MVQLLVTLVIVGLLLWAVNAIIPMDPTIKKIVNVVAIVLVCLFLLSSFGLVAWPVRMR
jgi:hypothetical protein